VSENKFVFKIRLVTNKLVIIIDVILGL